MLSRLIILLVTSLACTLVHADLAVPPGPMDAGVNAPPPAGPSPTTGLSDDDKSTIAGYVLRCRNISTKKDACCSDNSGHSCAADAATRNAIHATSTQVTEGPNGGGLA